MLPGFRFLSAAIVLTVSFLIFGLGAAALLRASHERFASLPTRPPPAATFARPEDATPPTLAILRVEPAPVEAATPILPPVDTLLPTDRLAALSAASRSEDIVELKPEPPTVEPNPAPSAEAVAESVVAPPVVVSAEPVVTTKAEEPALTEPPPPPPPSDVPQQVAALPAPEITGGIAATPALAEPPLVNAAPIRRPPVPKDRPAATDVVVALPPPDIAKPIVRKRKPAVKRFVKKPRAVARARARPPAVQTPNPASPFGASGFGASPFGT